MREKYEVRLYAIDLFKGLIFPILYATYDTHMEFKHFEF